MGYALFAQRKLVLDGQLNNAQLQQTQRSNEQYAIATQTLSLQQQLTSMNAAQSQQLSELYSLLSSASETGIDTSKMDKDDLDKLSPDAKDLVNNNANRDQINDAIKAKELEFEKEINNINNQIYQVSVKENAIEMEVKRLDTQVTALQKQMEATEQAEGGAIGRATPKFGGVG